MSKIVETAAENLERERNPQWDAELNSIWWNDDPHFCQNKTSWGWFTGTRKEKAIHEAELIINSVIERKLEWIGEDTGFGSNVISNPDNNTTYMIRHLGVNEYDVILYLKIDEFDYCNKWFQNMEPKIASFEEAIAFAQADYTKRRRNMILGE